MVSTQASQLRLTQRGQDTGWVDIPAVLHRGKVDGGWTEAMAVAYTSTLQVNGGTATYHGLYERQANSKAMPHRVRIGAMAKVSTQQRAGTLSHIKKDGTTYDYPLVITPEGYLTPLYPNQQKWQQATTGDMYQFTGTWSIA